MSQVSLFPTQDRARRRRRDPETSLWAANGIDVTKGQAIVMTAFINGPATHDQLCERIAEYQPHVTITPQSVRSRCSELVGKGLVEWSGKWGTSANGGKARIWRRKL